MKSWCVDRWIPLSKIWYLFIIWRYHSQLDFGPCLLSLFLFTLYECNLFGIWHDFFMSNYKTHLIIQCFNFGDNVFPWTHSRHGDFKPFLSLGKVSEKLMGVWPFDLHRMIWLVIFEKSWKMCKINRDKITPFLCA